LHCHHLPAILKLGGNSYDYDIQPQRIIHNLFFRKASRNTNLLSAHKIEYTISTMGNTWQANSRGFGINTLAQIEYKIYVKKRIMKKLFSF